MNRIYRSIWNQATGAYAAVSENVNSAGKRSLPGSGGTASRFVLTSMAAALMLGYGSLALAGPTGGTVVAGQATINGTPGATVIKQGSQNAVINWASFNVGKGESVQFVQPNSNAVALNRVLGSDGTTILGNLSANGKVFIVNPNGVLFGQGASVNTAGLVASTLDINNADFMAGKYQFAGNGTGKVLNQGSISAPGGYVALLGANVSNEGTIQARLGSVALAAGRAITLDVAGDGLLNVAVNAGAVGALVNNGGMIRADGGSVVLTAQAAGDLLKTVVNNTGVIEAQTIDTRSGTIKLLGDMQSGTVNAGGTLDASAPVSGKGGFIDTSAAHVKIDDALKVTTAAPKGLTGMWLIDPTDFTIAASGGDQTGAFYSNALKSSNVSIATVASGGAAGDINVNDTISWSANKLTLTAHNNIHINAPLRGSGTASLALEYGQRAGAPGNGGGYYVNATVDLPTGNNFSTRQGNDGDLVNYTVINSVGVAGSLSGIDLQGINGNMQGNYVLGSHIDASATADWNGGTGFSPLGGVQSPILGMPFMGKFDGLGHDIVGLTFRQPQDGMSIGMFSAIASSGVVRNVNLINTVMRTDSNAFGWSYMGMLAGANAGLIENVSAHGNVSLSGRYLFGGLVGANDGTITDSRTSGSVDYFSATGQGAGGLVHTNGEEGVISNSSSSMRVTVTGGAAGGLAETNIGAITKSFATGAVTGATAAGGLVANAWGTITDSHATGAVTGSGSVGGLVGFAGPLTINNSYAIGKVTSSGNGVSYLGYGGLVGTTGSATVISNSYAIGAVSGTNFAGGVVGWNRGTLNNVYAFGKVTAQQALPGGVAGYSNGRITNAYFNSSANAGLQGIGQSNAGGGTGATGLTEAQMRNPASFAGFTFTTTPGRSGNNWVTVGANTMLNGSIGGTLPMLSSEYSTTINSAHQLQLMTMDRMAAYTVGSSFSAASTAGGDVWGSAGFVPVGDIWSDFRGSVNGAGHIISGLYMNNAGNNATGLIGNIGRSGRISDLGLSDVNINGTNYVGGFAGENAGKISGSFVSGTISGSKAVGALVGRNYGEIQNSYATGSATGGMSVGGLAGENNFGAIGNSYAAVVVRGAGALGGLAGGTSESSRISSSYWDTQISGQASSLGGTGLTTAQLKNLANYNGTSSPAWDLNNTWVVYDGHSGPLLRSFMTPLLVTAANASKVYDGTAGGNASGISYSRPVDPALLLGTAVLSGNAVNVGTHAVRISGLYSTAQNGYLISYVDGSLTITPRQISLGSVSADSKVYDGTTAAILRGGNLVGVVGDDLAKLNLSLSGSYASKNVGTHISIAGNATLGGSASGNYILAPLSDMYGDITPALITSIGGILAGNKVYNGLTGATIDTSAAVFGGKIAADVLTIDGVGAFSDKNAGQGKTVNISGLQLGGADAGNYALAISSASTSADITPKALTLASIADKVYDGNHQVSFSGGVLNGLVGTETLGVTGKGTYADKNAGNDKAVTIGEALFADAGSGATAGVASNYVLATPHSVTGNISKATISAVTDITVNSKTYDGTVAATVKAHSGLLNGKISGDDLAFNSSAAAFSDKNAGSNKTVHVGGITLTGADAGNYVLASSSATATADITRKVLTLDAVTAGDKIYDGNATASLSGGTLSGMVGMETLGMTGMHGQFGDKNAGADKRVSVSGTTLVDTASGLASNYVVAEPTGLSASITPKALTLAGIVANNKVYDGTSKASLSGAVLSGLVEMETLELAGLSAAFADKHAGKDKAVTVSGATLRDTAHGLASNYTLGNPTGLTAEISRAVIGGIGGIKAGNKVYDGNSSVLLDTRSAVFYGMVAGDSLGLASASGVFSDKNAASGKTVHIGGLALSGADAGNYVLGTDVASTWADITARSLTLSGVVAGDKVYDGNRHASLSGGVLSGLVAGESVGLAGLTGSFGDKNVDNGKAVIVTGTTLLDTASGLASNYVVAEPTGLSASITPKALTLAGIVANNKVYDGNMVASLSGGSLSGLVESETLGFAGLSGKFSDKNAGKDKAVTVKGATLFSTASGAADNYTLSDPTGLTASITPATLTVSITAGNKVYDATANASVSWRDDRLAGDQLSVAGNAAHFVDKQAGQGKLVSMDGIRLSGLDAGNYVVNARATTRADIAQAQLTVTANNAEKGQGRPNPVFDASYAGWLAGDSVASELNGSLQFDTLAGTASPSGTYKIAASGLTSNNYAIRYVDGTLKVNPTEAVQSAVTAAVAAVSAVPRAGNMVVAEHVRGVENKASTTIVAAPVMAGANGAVSRNVLPGLQLSVLERGILLPAELSTAMP
ncbi:YDG domain-containing protein [Janthinobacterium tructae]